MTKISIQKYGAYFHDGSLIAIEQAKNELVLSLDSAEVSLDEIQEKIVLSEHSTIKGKLHLDSIQKAYESDREISPNEISMLHDSGGILHLKISSHLYRS